MLTSKSLLMSTALLLLLLFGSAHAVSESAAAVENAAPRSRLIDYSSSCLGKAVLLARKEASQALQYFISYLVSEYTMHIMM